MSATIPLPEPRSVLLSKSASTPCADLGLAYQPKTTVELTPAVPIKRSVNADHLVCLEDGKKLKILKRHLMTDHGMTPAAYRARWAFKPDYPMVAPDYSAQRRVFAKQIGLGRSPLRRAAAPPELVRRRKTEA